MASVNQTQPHCVNQMGKTHYKPLVARHGNVMLCVKRPLMSSDSKKKEPRYTCVYEALASSANILYECETKASHLYRMWAEVSSSALQLLHNGLSGSPRLW
jgi:hypothetical protein